LPRRDPAQAPRGPVARSATEAFLDSIGATSDTYDISSTTGMDDNSRKSLIPRKTSARQGRPRLKPEEKTDHVKTTFSLPPETIGLIERLRTAPELYTDAVPSKSDVVTEAVRRLACALQAVEEASPAAAEP